MREGRVKAVERRFVRLVNQDGSMLVRKMNQLARDIARSLLASGIVQVRGEENDQVVELTDKGARKPS